MSKFTISQGPTWQIPLRCKPEIAHISIAVHGPSKAEPHRVDGYWSIHLYTYNAAVVFGGVEHAIGPNFVGILPPGVDTMYSFPARSTHACAHFAFPVANESTGIEIPAMQDVGRRFPALYKEFEEAITCFRGNSLQADVRLWDILWQIASPHETGQLAKRHHHPAVQRASELIDLRLSDSLTVPELAEMVELSHNQLTRLFRAQYGTTVVGYIQQRRANRAEHLLIHTQMPIRAIAAQVGIDDTRLFNKVMHKMLGASPSEIRLRGERIHDG